MTKEITLYIDSLPLQELYDSGMTSYEIADFFKISQYAVWRRLKETRRAVARIPPTKGKFGEDHPAYRNGTGIYRRICEENKDVSKCFECSSNVNIHIHHIDHNHDNNNPNNLIPLCKSCHCKEHELINNIIWMSERK